MNRTRHEHADSPLWLVCTPDGRYPKTVRASSARGALMARVKDDTDVPKGGVWAVWRLGNFPEQFEIFDREPEAPFLRPVGRPHV